MLISLQLHSEFFSSLTSGYSPFFVLFRHYLSGTMASSVSILVLFALILPNSLETNCNIQYMSNGLCDFGCEIKLVSDKSRFARNQIFDGNFKAVHLDQRMEDSSHDFLSLEEAWNILQPFWVKDEYSGELLRILSSVQFEKYSFKSSKTVFRTNVRLLDTLPNGCNVTAMPPECLIRAVSYSLLRNVTRGTGFVCYSVLVKKRLENVCCDLTTGNSVQCKQAAIGSNQWEYVLLLNVAYLVILYVTVSLLFKAVWVIPSLPYGNPTTSDEEDMKMVEPDQDVNPITKYVQRQFAGKLVRIDCKAYGTAAIILTLSILVFVGILYALIFSENLDFQEKSRRYYILEALPVQTESNFQHFLKRVGSISRSAFDRTPFRIFCLVWFYFCVIPLPPLLYITGLSSSWNVLLQFRCVLSKRAEEPIVGESTKLLEDKCFNTSANSSPMYLFEVFVGIVVRFLPFIVRIAFYVVVACGVAVLLMFHPFLLFMILIPATSISILRETLRQTRVTSVQEVQIAGHLLFFLSTIYFSVIGFWYTSISVSRILAISFTYSLLGLSINHNILLPYMTCYGTFAYLMFFIYSSYLCGYVELRELAFDACTKILEEKGDEQDIRQVVFRDDKGVIRINEKLLEHIYSEMKPLKKTVRKILFWMVVCCGLFYLFHRFIIEDEGTQPELRVPPLMQVVLTLSVGVCPKLYVAYKTGPADKRNLAHMKKKARVEKIVTTFIKETCECPTLVITNTCNSLSRVTSLKTRKYMKKKSSHVTYDQDVFHKVIWV